MLCFQMNAFLQFMDMLTVKIADNILTTYKSLLDEIGINIHIILKWLMFFAGFVGNHVIDLFFIDAMFQNNGVPFGKFISCYSNSTSNVLSNFIDCMVNYMRSKLFKS